jgi:phosphoadenosine phosphosulfate reductase
MQKILQSHLVGGTQESHVKWLSDEIDAPVGGVVVDAGCGYGEVARLMSLLRPDVSFDLINPDLSQLELAPIGSRFRLHDTGYESMPMSEESADCVLFAYSMGFGDWRRGLREAWRVLKPGGKLLCYEPHGVEAEFVDRFGYYQPSETFCPPGFDLVKRVYPDADSGECERFIAAAGQQDEFDATFAKCHPVLHVFVKDEDPSYLRPKMALQFSGGKDSIALLLLNRDCLDDLIVYFLDTGDTNPETLAVVEWAENLAPNFVRINSPVEATWRNFGYPSDIVPFSSSDCAAAIGVRKTLLLQDRYNCCFRTIMAPLHQRMLDDGVTTIIRGQKDADDHKGPYRSGQTDEANGFTFIYPLESWTDQQVFDYINEAGGPLPNFYRDGYEHVGDCLRCTAWLTGRRGEYLKKNHPAAFQEYRLRLIQIRDAITPSVAHLMQDLEV